MARQSLNPVSLDDDIDGKHGSEFASREHYGKRRRNDSMTHLKYLRKRRGLTLEALSEVTKISVSYLSRLESGSRRLNTDLIRRLSRAFGCDPAELLQDVTHDEASLIGASDVRMSRSTMYSAYGRRNMDFSSRGYHPIEVSCDLPVYAVSSECSEDDSKTCIKVKMGEPIEHRYRPVELLGQKDAFALKVGDAFRPYYSSGSLILLNQMQNIAPEATVLIVTESETVMLKKVWSITPTSIQLCDVDQLELLKKNKGAANIVSLTGETKPLIELDRGSLKAIYRVVGHMELEAAA